MNLFTSLKVIDGGELLKNKPSVIIKQTDEPGKVKLRSGFLNDTYELVEVDYDEKEERSKGKAAAGAVGGGIFFGIFGAFIGGLIGGRKKKKSKVTLLLQKGSKDYTIKAKCKSGQLKILKKMT